MKSDSDFQLAAGNKVDSSIEATQTQDSGTPHTPDAKTTPPETPGCGFLPNDKIGRYVVIRELGTGGFGHVVLADDLKLRRKVAVKFPRRDRASALKKGFLEEGRSVARLDHPSIIKLYNIEETDDKS